MPPGAKLNVIGQFLTVSLLYSYVKFFVLRSQQKPLEPIPYSYVKFFDVATATWARMPTPLREFNGCVAIRTVIGEFACLWIACHTTVA
jgi:hypothetical protein